MDQVATSPSPSILTRIAGQLRSGFGDRIPVRRRSPDSGLALPAGIALRLGGAVLATLIGGAQPSAQLIQLELADLSSGLDLATTAAEAGQLEEARRLFVQLQEHFPDAAEPRLGLANLIRSLAAQGRIQEAAELYRPQPNTYWRRRDRDSLERMFAVRSGSALSAPDLDASGEDHSEQPQA